MNKRQE